jgi:hypothetical protein
MSLIAMSASAVERLSPPATAVASVSPPAQPAASAVGSALSVIVTYIPSEILTLYVAILALLQPGSLESRAVVLAVFLLLTPLTVWLLYSLKKGARDASSGTTRPWLPLWEMAAASVCFAVWAAALPQSPFPWPRVAAVVVLVTATFLPLVDRLVRSRVRGGGH